MSVVAALLVGALKVTVVVAAVFVAVAVGVVGRLSWEARDRRRNQALLARKAGR